MLAAQIFDWIRSGFILRHLFVTMQETILGFLLGTLLGVAVGFTFARWQTLAHIFDPLMVALERHAARRARAASSFSGSASGCSPRVVMVVSAGLLRRVLQHLHRHPRGGSRPRQQRAHPGANPRHMIRHVLLPSALTWIFSSLRTSVGFALHRRRGR